MRLRWFVGETRAPLWNVSIISTCVLLEQIILTKLEESPTKYYKRFASLSIFLDVTCNSRQIYSGTLASLSMIPLNVVAIIYTRTASCDWLLCASRDLGEVNDVVPRLFMWNHWSSLFALLCELTNIRWGCKGYLLYIHRLIFFIVKSTSLLSFASHVRSLDTLTAWSMQSCKVITVKPH